MALGFAVLGFALAFWQRPGWATSDTKIDLHVDPGSFLSEVASVWSPSIDLGAVQGAQYSGYLWPMGPVFALLHGLGLSPWVAQRIWLGAAVRGVGVGDAATAGRVRRPAARRARTCSARGVLPAQPVHGHLHRPDEPDPARLRRAAVAAAGRPPRRARRVALARLAGWWWAAVFALILTSIGGGINAAVVGWMLVGPLVLLVYEPLVGSVRWRDAWAFLVRMGVLGTCWRRCGGSCRWSCTPATGSTSSSSPSSRARSGPRTAPPRRCA